MAKVPLRSLEEIAGSPSHSMNNPPAPHRLVDLPTEPTLLPAASAVEKDYNGQCNMANGFIPVLLTISATLIATISGQVYPDRSVLRAIDPALALTNLVSNFGLLLYSLSNRPGAKLAKVQMTVMGFSMVLLVLAAFFRLALLFTWQQLLAMVVTVVVKLIGLLFLLCYRRGRSSSTIVP